MVEVGSWRLSDRLLWADGKSCCRVCPGQHRLRPRRFGVLLHAIMTTAVEDGLIRRSPCHIKGAGQEHSDERPVAPIATLVELLGNVPERYRALLLLATFANLRFGELAGLRRGQLNLDACEVRVNASTAEMDDGRLIDGDPKSRAGTRTVSFPADIVPELADHLERFAEAGPDGFVFIGPKGGRLRRAPASRN
jgi:integrase